MAAKPVNALVENTDAALAAFKVLSGHSGEAFVVAFDPQNIDIIASGSADSSIKFWNLKTFSLLFTIDNAHSTAVRSLAYYNNNKPLLASGAYDTPIKIWDTTRYELVATLTGHSSRVLSVAFDPTRPGIMASGSLDTYIKVWDLNVDAPSDDKSLVTTLSGSSPINALVL